MTPVVSSGGTYTIEVLDTSNGCSAVMSVIVSENTNGPTASAGNPMTIDCINSCVVLDGTGSTQTNTSVTWITADGNIVSGGNTFTPTVCTAGTYEIIVTDVSSGCTASSSVVVTEDLTEPVADAGPDMIINCNQTSVTLDGSNSSQSPDITYFWTTLDGNIVSGETTTTPVVNAPGTYNLLTTDTNNGCESNDEVVVTENIAPTVTLVAQTNVACNGDATGSATIAGADGNPPYSFTWSNGGTGNTQSNLVAGTYGYTLTDEDNCTSSGMVTITEPDALMVNGTATNETSAGGNDGTATASPTGGTPDYNYLWSNGATDASISNLAPGNYTVTVTDANSCTASETLTVGSFDCSSFTIAVEAFDVNCNGGSDGAVTVTVLSGASPVTCLWSTGSTSQTEMNLPAGNYSVTCTDANGCEIVNTVTINQPSAIMATVSSITHIDCAGASTGKAEIVVSGGTAGYTFEWNNGANVLCDVPAGTYTVTITDANACTATTEAIITEAQDASKR